MALVLFRLSAALWIVGASAPALQNYFWPAALLLMSAIGLAAGFATRILSGIGVAALVIVTVARGRYPTAAEAGFVLISAGVALIGPGAYSIDAAIFGRRTVHLPD